jgi:hypothetical protein
MRIAFAIAVGYAGGLLAMQPGPAAEPEPRPLCQQQTVEEEAALYREIIDQQRRDIDELHGIIGKYHRLIGLYRARVKAAQSQADGWYAEITRLCAVIEAHECSADLNDDGVVDNLDHLIMLAQWTRPEDEPPDPPP